MDEAPPNYEGKELTIPFAVDSGGVSLEYRYSLVCPVCRHTKFGIAYDYSCIICMSCHSIMLKREIGNSTGWII